MQYDQSDLQREVQELTHLMRNEPALQGLRDFLLENQVDPATSLLGGLTEGEDGEEWGVVVDAGQRVFTFSRVWHQGVVETTWEAIADVSELCESYPALETAIATFTLQPRLTPP